MIPEPHGCRWIDGEGKDRRWCDQEIETYPYCPEHRARAYVRRGKVLDIPDDKEIDVFNPIASVDKIEIAA